MARHELKRISVENIFKNSQLQLYCIRVRCFLNKFSVLLFVLFVSSPVRGCLQIVFFTDIDDSLHACSSDVTLFSVKMFYSQHYVIEFAPNLLQIYWTHLFSYYIPPHKICLNRVQKNSSGVCASLKKPHELQWQCLVTPFLVVAYKATSVFFICFHWLLVTS